MTPQPSLFDAAPEPTPEPEPQPTTPGRWLPHDQWTWDDWHRLWRNPPKPRTEPEGQP